MTARVHAAAAHQFTRLNSLRPYSVSSSFAYLSQPKRNLSLSTLRPSTTTFCQRQRHAQPQPQPTPQHSTIQSRKMSSDDAYASFLDKANQQISAESGPADPGDVETSSSEASGFHATKTVDHDQTVPRALTDVGEIYYVSEADELFEPIVLGWEDAASGRWPNNEQFKSLIFPTPPRPSLASEISIDCVPPSSFDPQNHYAAVLKAVSTAAAGGNDGEGAKAKEPDLRIWRVGYGRSRAEYWILGLEEDERRIVGMKAKAVET